MKQYNIMMKWDFLRMRIGMCWCTLLFSGKNSHQECILAANQVPEVQTSGIEATAVDSL